VDAVIAGSPAERGGFRAGDVILELNGRPVDGFSDVKRTAILSTGTPMAFVVDRGGVRISLTATPERGDVLDQVGKTQRLGVLGLSSRARAADAVTKRYNPIQAVARGAQMSWDGVAMTVKYIGRMITGRENSQLLSGPLGMAQMSGDMSKRTAELSPDGASLARNWALTMLEMVANISVGIGFLNLLPIPVLDGGHLLFYGYEAVARRPLAAKVQAAGYRVGLALVLGLMLFATWNDLQRLRVFNLLGGLFS
jgi:regulator of sigma E protease